MKFRLLLSSLIIFMFVASGSMWATGKGNTTTLFSQSPLVNTVKGVTDGKSVNIDPTLYRTFRVSDFQALSAPVNRTGHLIRGRRPTAGNVRDSVFANFAFGLDTPEDGGLLRVGLRRTDSSQYYGWFFYFKFRYSPSEVRFYIFGRSAPRRGPNYLPFTGEKRIASLMGNTGNRLTSELIALKTSVAASDLGITPTGLGDLIFFAPSGPEVVLNGRTIRQIIGTADSAITLGLRWQTQFPSSYLSLLGDVVARINNEFYSSTIDTVSTMPLVLQGVKTIAGVPYLQGAVEVHSWNRQTMKQMMSVEPAQFELSQNYPNPFNPSTTIRYTLPQATHVTLTVYDALGREVATLVNDMQEEGEQSVEFDAANYPSGVYLYKIQAGTHVNVRKMVLMK